MRGGRERDRGVVKGDDEGAKRETEDRGASLPTHRQTVRNATSQTTHKTLETTHTTNNTTNTQNQRCMTNEDCYRDLSPWSEDYIALLEAEGLEGIKRLRSGPSATALIRSGAPVAPGARDRVGGAEKGGAWAGPGEDTAEEGAALNPRSSLPTSIHDTTRTT